MQDEWDLRETVWKSFFLTKKYDDKVVLSSILRVTVPPFALQTEEQVEKGKNVKVGF